MDNKKKRETWNSRTGVILAVAGSAVGLANFLRFPGNVAQYGGGAFMLAYFISLLVVAIPLAWAEWTMGRYGGLRGFSSCPGIFNVISKNRFAKFLGILGVLVPIIIYMYYAYVESWCLGYAVNFLTGNLNFSDVNESQAFWVDFIGAAQNGSAIGFGFQQVGFYLFFAFLLNFTLIYRGISKGIEAFTKIAVPTLIVLAFVVLFRVLSLGTPNPEKPDWNIQNGLGFMWNPNKVYVEELGQDNKWKRVNEVFGDKEIAKQEVVVAANPSLRMREVTAFEQLKSPKLWLAAASQVFFSLSVGLGLIITYASYMKKDDDVVLSSLCASSANEFCEVGLGGLISVPAAFAFLGAAGVVGQGIFGLGFKVLPMVFSSMPLGGVFGAVFFFILFIAAVNASISCLQPSIAFLEETLHLNRHKSVAAVSTVTALGCGFVVWFSQDAKALDSLDFWAGNFLVFVIATIQIIFFGWVMGIDKGFKEAHKGAAVTIPNIFKFISKYLCPLFLFTIFTMWILIDVFGLAGTGIDSHILDLIGGPEHPVSTVAWTAIGIITLIYIGFAIITGSCKAYKQENIKR